MTATDELLTPSLNISGLTPAQAVEAMDKLLSRCRALAGEVES